jgi:hypothetical protein
MSRVSPSHKNTTFLTLHTKMLTFPTKILTFPRREKTPIGIGQPSTNHEQEEVGDGEEDV